MEKTQLSVIIATHNSEELIERCLNSLTTQSFPRENFEIIVVDDGSTDKSVEIAKRAGADKVIQTEPCSLAQARNIGVKNSAADNFAFLDSDCEAKDGWVRVIIRELKNVDALSGPILNGNPQSHIAWAEYFVEFGGFHEFKKRSPIRFLPGCNGACTKNAFMKSGGFTDLHACDDVLFGESLRKVGVEPYFIPEMHIKHLCRTELKKVLNNMKLLGTYSVRTRRVETNVPFQFMIKSKWLIPIVFLGRMCSNCYHAYQSRKLQKFFQVFPLIVKGNISFCKGILEELKVKS